MINNLQRQTTIENPNAYKILIFLTMVYMSIMLCNAILTNCYIGTDVLFVLGGTFTSPLVFILDDIIAEIYGYKIARFVIITGYFAQTMIVIICLIVIQAPHPSFFTHQSSYDYVLGVSLLRINISGFIAYIFSNLMNSYILTRWKFLVKGKYFWLRSLGSSIFSEILYSFIAILMMELSSIPLKEILKVATISFSIKAFYSIVLAYPANILVDYLKRVTGIDVYDFPKKFTPLKYSREIKEVI
ncbi:queuosine precursor transporter [Legionella sp.]|uniref:queuosine precursor transporter n=1 Tax=Legionella sp. TaxID=459 RepID=UPI000CC16BF9|nr:queuosine precursor transporter [Legionella sp.]PJE14244.1 MAG: hypothetical protein CK430_05380 [Legionella sp.]